MFDEIVKDGFIISKDRTILYGFRNKEDRVIVIPDSIRTIEKLDGLSYNTDKIVIGKNVEMINMEALYYLKAFRREDEVDYERLTFEEFKEKLRERQMAEKDLAERKKEMLENPIQFEEKIPVIEVDAENPYLFAENSLLYAKDYNGYRLISCQNDSETIKIKDGTRVIGRWAFGMNLKQVKKVLVPNTLEEIDYEGFYCYGAINTITIDDDKHRKLDNVVCLPEKIKKLNRKTFCRCNFTEIKISDNIEQMDRTCFYSCDLLTKVTLPKNLVNISCDAKEYYDTFENCSKLCELEISNENNSFETIDGILFNKEKTKILKVPPAYESKCYTVPDGVKDIETSFSYCTKIDKVVLNKEITELKKRAFSKSKIKTIEVPSNVIKIDSEAFPTNITIIGEVGSKAEQFIARYEGKERYKRFFIPIENICKE